MLRVLLLMSLMLAPHTLLAAVTINEVAWMGSINSANDEWIELYNNGSAVSLDGWTLSDGMNLQIVLSGTLAGNTYGVLERTDDDSAPGNAFMVYTGALPNTGATLILRRSDGSIEDQVAGGSDWAAIGGDNTTKETAQYTTSGWITGTPTPGMVNVTAASTNSTSHTTQTVPTQNTSSKDDEDKNVYVSLVEPDNELILHVDGPAQAFVNQPVELSVNPFGLGERIMDSLSYEWNFGDLHIGQGQEVTTQYRTPGTYVIIVSGAYTKYEARARHLITVLPMTIAITRNEGDILLHNTATYEIELSHYTLRGEKDLHFPPNTFLAPKATLRIPRDRVEEAYESLVALYDTAGQLTASWLPEYLVTEREVIQEAPIARTVQTPSIRQAVATPKVSATSTTRTSAETTPDPLAESEVAAVAATRVPADKIPYLGLAGLIAIGVLAVYVQTPTPKDKQPFDLQ